ncbi:MAG TPA: flagellin [Acidobacteriaceae bacterium]
MSLGILNNIAALYAENNLNSTQSSLQNTLQQLSSGSRINSGADDAAGLAVSDGLHANEAALAQSSQNATSGIGLLQTADGALSQVTNLLDRAVTLATESANGTLTAGQVSSANQEYQNILQQIGNIGSTTNFNSSNVFSSNATNIVVTDGTSSGLNTYADTIGALTTASVGTSAGTAVQTSTLTPVTTQPVAAVTKVAGQYTLTPAVKTDTLSGQLSFTVGSGSEIDIAITSGNTTAVKTQLMADTTFTGAGLSASVTASTGALVITGPTSGANVAANTIDFTGTALTDSVAVPTITGAVGVTASAGTASKGQLTVASAANADTFAGHIILTQGSESLDINIASGSVFGAASDPTTVQGQIAAAITAQPSSTHFAVATEGGTADNPILKFTGDNNTTAITISGNFADTTTSASGTVTDNAGTAGTAPKAGTYVLSAMGSSTDTFGTGSTITIAGEAVVLDGLDGAGAAAAITADTVLSGLGITAAFDSSSKKLTVSGKADGTTFTASQSGITDVSSATPGALDPSALVQTKAPAGNSAIAAGTSVVTLGNASDTLSGSLTVAVTGGKTGTLTIKSGTSGAALATQITQNASFIAAGITAAYDSSAHAITLTGPTGASKALTVTGTLTDSTASVPGAGADFTASTVSQLTSATAATVLTTVTAAVADVAYQRGTIGADINQLTSASNVASSEGVNLTSAEESVRATDYGTAASNLSKYQILSQTGISALAQANSVQQEVLKLLQ